MKNWDVIVIGAGIIGVSLALELHRDGANVLVLDSHEPAHEASYAAAGMIAHCDPHTPPELQPFAIASARMYPEYIHEIETESQSRVDFRREGTIAFFPENEQPQFPLEIAESVTPLSPEELAKLDPQLSARPNAWYLPENAVDPRGLMVALMKAARHSGIDVIVGSPVVEVELEAGRVTGARTDKTKYPAATVVNCAGAWASQIAPLILNTRPVKGQMLCVVFQRGIPGAPLTTYGPSPAAHGPLLRHVVRAGGLCYIVPRSDGRLVIGSTMEEVGFDKRVDTEVIQRLHQSAALLAPEIGEGRILEAWTGLRPGTPDCLPLMGATSITGYYACTGHFRDGIMLAPGAAQVMAQVIAGKTAELDIAAFAPERF
ncbi:MAG TPA: glycine oxidase ThiO [Clostridia bacterium]|nr:glycine oxidase ThiO [Clostridia bacterium]